MQKISEDKFYITCYDRMGQRRITAWEVEEDGFTVHEFHEDGEQVVGRFVGGILDIVKLGQAIGTKLMVVAPQPSERATAFSNRFAQLLTSKMPSH